MDAAGFDRLARALWVGATRRGVLRGLLTAVLVSLPIGNDAEARRGGGPTTHRDVAAERKRRKRRKKRCKPRCAGRVCGPDGCGGSCGECAAPTSCDAQGRCVGCVTADHCAPIPCRAASCTAGICQYAESGDGTACGNGKTCCSGDCTNTRLDGDHCGACGNACAADEACFAGECITGCDVCAAGCAFTSVQAALDAAAAGATVTLCPGDYQERITLRRDVTIAGVGADPAATRLVNPSTPIVRVESNVSGTLRNLTVTKTGTTASNDLINNSGALRLETVHVVGAPGVFGRGITNNGNASTLVLVDSVIRDGSSSTFGGGIHNFGGSVTLTRSLVEKNVAPVGGGVRNDRGTLILTGASKISNNTATGSGGFFGGGVFNDGEVIVTGISTISGNDPDQCVNAGSGTGCPA